MFMFKPICEIKKIEWKLYMDGAFNNVVEYKALMKGIGIVLKGLEAITIEYALKLFFEATTNTTKYKALVKSLNLAKEIKPKGLNIYSDS